MKKNIFFRNTKREDYDKVMRIYADAREFMAKSGNPYQWGDWHPKKELILDDIERKIGYVCELDGKIAASFMFYVGIDESYNKIYNGSWKNKDAYGVIHRIAVADDMHGKGISKLCFDFCIKKCVESGVYNLKIDTHKDNLPMQKALLKYGFTYCGIVYINGELERMAYQYQIKK